MKLQFLLALAVIAVGWPTRSQAQTFNDVAFDPSTIELPALTADRRDVMIEANRQIIAEARERIAQMRAREAADGVNLSQAIARAEGTIEQSEFIIARLNGQAEAAPSDQSGQGDSDSRSGQTNDGGDGTPPFDPNGDFVEQYERIADHVIPELLRQAEEIAPVAEGGQVADLPVVQEVLGRLLGAARQTQLLGDEARSEQVEEMILRLFNGFIDGFSATCAQQEFNRQLAMGFEHQLQMLGSDRSVEQCAYREMELGPLPLNGFRHCGLGYGDWRFESTMWPNATGSAQTDHSGNGTYQVHILVLNRLGAPSMDVTEWGRIVTTTQRTFDNLRGPSTGDPLSEAFLLAFEFIPERWAGSFCADDPLRPNGMCRMRSERPVDSAYISPLGRPYGGFFPSITGGRPCVPREGAN